MRCHSVVVALLVILGAGRSQRTGSKCPYPNGRFPHDSYCDYYFECQENVAYDLACPDGQVFDIYSGHCALPFGVDCTGRPNLQPAQPTEHCPRRWGYYPHEADCNLFWNCNDGVGILKMCPRGLAFDDYRGICNWPDLVQRCDSEVMFGFKCPNPTAEDLVIADPPRYAAASGCTSDFFVCVEDPYEKGRLVPRLLTCPDYHSYDPYTRNCTLSEYVAGCGGLSSPGVSLEPPQQYLFQTTPRYRVSTRAPGRNTADNRFRYRG